MTSLMDRIAKSGSIKSASIIAESKFFGAKPVVKTDLPILNVAFTGSMDGGLVPGLTIVAGPSKSFKTLLCLYCMKAYLDKHKDGIAILYDSEFGITPDYLRSIGIDTTRVLHIPILHVEELKFDIVKRLDEITNKDKVFIMIDSLGALASKKEVEDAENEKSVADMSRAKAIRSIFRITTPHFTMKDIPCMVVNHIYMTQEMYAKVVIPGGTAVEYSANQIFTIGRAQEKDGDEISGYKFTITIHKSRTIKEKSKLPFRVSFENGINQYSGMLELAQEAGQVVKVKPGRYQLVDDQTGEILGDEDSHVSETETESPEFLGVVMKRKSFNDFIMNLYLLSPIKMGTQDNEELQEEVEGIKAKRKPKGSK